MCSWSAIPDPRDPTCPKGTSCAVLVEDHRWSHLTKHINDLREPWNDWLPSGLVTAWRGSFQVGVSDEQRQSIRQQVSDQMADAARRSLNVPLAVLYVVHMAQARTRQGKNGSPWSLTVDLVLPCGAKLCLRERDNQTLSLCTCYFISTVWSAPVSRRWRLLARQLIMRHAKANGNGSFLPPGPAADQQTNEETHETFVPREFRTDATWGLDGKMIDPWDRLSAYGGSVPSPGRGAGLNRRRPSY